MAPRRGDQPICETALDVTVLSDCTAASGEGEKASPGAPSAVCRIVRAGAEIPLRESNVTKSAMHR